MTAINEVTDLTIDGEVAVLTLNSPPVNALSAPVRDGLAFGIEQATANKAVKVVVLICQGQTFIAGADISEHHPQGRDNDAQPQLLRRIRLHPYASDSVTRLR